ncbi:MULTISPECIES: hypothetical protein [unclassified Mesorhizobium]|nr:MULTISPECIES: hypothetical protein [unclassified Mesorhizobium]
MTWAQVAHIDLLAADFAGVEDVFFADRIATVQVPGLGRAEVG